MFSFSITYRDSRTLARLGLLSTPHGTITTPAFIPVATKASIKALTPQQLQDIGFDSILCNTYHLYLQPGPDIIQQTGGLHKFCGWSGPIFTDSGGFQVFSLNSNRNPPAHSFSNTSRSSLPNTSSSLANQPPSPSSSHSSTNSRRQPTLPATNPAISTQPLPLPPPSILPKSQTLQRQITSASPPRRLCQINDDHVIFRSCLDHSIHHFTPEKSIQIQRQLGADIIFAFDQCLSIDSDYLTTLNSLKRTHAWEQRSFDEFQKLNHDNTQALYSIVQGGRYPNLRARSAAFASALPTFGIGIGSIFGHPKEESIDLVSHTLQHLPLEKPKHLLGIGGIDDLFHYIALGIDTFDCVLPTRLARIGQIFISPESGGNLTNKFRLRLTHSRYRTDYLPPEPSCHCYTCSNFTRAYLHHLHRANELLFYTLTTYHNLYFYHHLLSQIRTSILSRTFSELRTIWLSN